MIKFVCSEGGEMGNKCKVDCSRIYLAPSDPNLGLYHPVMVAYDSKPHLIYSYEGAKHVSYTAKWLILPTDKRKARRMLRSLPHVGHNARNYQR